MDPLTKSEYAFAALRDAVFAGALQPGDWIRAEEWAERLRLSETPVREALGRLEGLGLVEMYPHRGARVKARTREHIMETYLIRTALEVLASRLAIERTSDSEFDKLLSAVKNLTERMSRAFEKDNMALVRDLNREIHMTIYEAPRLPRLLALIKSLWAAYPFDTLSLVPGRPEAALDQHQEILNALRARDAEKLATAMGHHMESAQQLLMRADFSDIPPLADEGQ